ncbi:uncharacterized protein AB675_9993 [Cyphellophora attinorum]|uniref:Uncharacterized protein n=1 Tax=Cyphellophora attinorum TaxID=1664694 RepID=A0A0N1NYW7_9EURO|nr:uncharacterized protein AB675_9993 [Phialophora attinorum]KPI36694.1 hypothetical protein AB675_9993 [Phialophora attinorum]
MDGTYNYKNLDTPLEKPFTALTQRRWLYDRCEEDVFKLLIDTHRFRLNDNYTFLGEAPYYVLGDPSPNRGATEFRTFLKQAFYHPDNKGLLPSWFTKAKINECMAFARRTPSHHYNTMPEKSDILDYYGDPRMPMQLRMFAEQVLHRSPYGESGDAMMAFQAKLEREYSPGSGKVASMLNMDTSQSRGG